MKSCSKSVSTRRSIIASTGCTPRSLRDVGDRRVRRQPVLVHADALEVGRPRLRADATARRVVGVRSPRRRAAPELRDRAGSAAAPLRDRHGTSCHSGSRSNGTRVLNDNSTEMPRQCVCAITRRRRRRPRRGSRGGARRRGSRRSRTSSAPGCRREVAHPREGPRRVVSGSGAIMPPSAPSKMPAPSVAHHADEPHDLVPRREPRRDRPVVGRLVVLAARRREADGAGADRVRELLRHRARGRRRRPRASNARSPIAHVRSAEWPMFAAKLMPFGRRVDGVEVLGERLEAPVDALGERRRIDVLGALEVAHHQRAFASLRPARA